MGFRLILFLNLRLALFQMMVSRPVGSLLPSLRPRAQCFGFRASGLGLRISSSGSGVEISEFRGGVWGSGLRVWALRFSVRSSEFQTWVLGLGG